MCPRITRRDFIKDIVKKGTALAVASRAIESFTSGDIQAQALEIAPGEDLREAMFYKQLEDGVKIQCLLEPRGCIVNNMERGYCGAKENRNGKYYSLVYSRPCAVYVEPVEREHFFHVLPGSQFLGIGTAGCNLGCKFCETWHISQVRPEETEMQSLPPDEAVRLAVSKGCRIITFTYNEPVICYEYVLETAKAAKQANLVTLCHTAGYVNEEPLKALLPYIDAVNVDLKGFTNKYYSDMCGVDLETVLGTLKTVRQKRVMLEITNLVVPGYNDDRQDIAKMTAWIKENLGTDVPLHFSRFFPNYQLKDLSATPAETLEMAYSIARSGGLSYVYIDNIPGHEFESTYCPKCKTRLIHRNGSEITVLELDKTGNCKKCRQKVPGIWD